MLRLNWTRRRRLLLSLFLGCLASHVTWAQQNIPPRPATLRETSAAKVREITVDRSLIHPEAFKAEVFKGATLSDAQKLTIMRNLGDVGFSMQAAPHTMQQYFGPVPPAQATGMACVLNYAGTPEELLALRKTVEGLIQKSQPAQLPAFYKGIPANCPYRELYFYLDLLAQLTKG